MTTQSEIYKSQVIHLRKTNPCATLKYIGAEVGISYERVRQILKENSLRTRHIVIIKKFHCINCGKPFTKWDKHSKFCSLKCHSEYRNIPCVCDNCGKLFYKKSYIITKFQYEHYYCSHRCQLLYQYKNNPKWYTNNGTDGMRTWNYGQSKYDLELIKKLYLNTQLTIKQIAYIVNSSYRGIESRLRYLRKKEQFPHRINVDYFKKKG